MTQNKYFEEKLSQAIKSTINHADLIKSAEHLKLDLSNPEHLFIIFVYLSSLNEISNNPDFQEIFKRYFGQRLWMFLEFMNETFIDKAIFFLKRCIDYTERISKVSGNYSNINFIAFEKEVKRLINKYEQLISDLEVVYKKRLENEYLILRNMSKFEIQKNLVEKFIFSSSDIPYKKYKFSDDFRVLIVDNSKYTFTSLQADALKCLFDAYNKEFSFVHHETIASDLNRDFIVMSDIFKSRKEFYNKYIDKNDKGFYRLI